MEQAMVEKPTKKIPEDIICPITSQIMTDPVILMESGNTYEREAILKWLKTKKSDPLTNEPITDETIAPNPAIKRLVVSFLDKNKAKNRDITHETYLPESLIETLLTAMQSQDPKGLMETLQKDARLLTHPLKEKKNLWVLACESANLELLTVIVDKLGAGIQTLEAMKSDRGQSLFLKVSRRLGLSGATLMAKALEWEPSDFQGLLNLAVQNDEVALAGIALSLGAVATMDLLNAAYAQKKTEIVKVLLAVNFTLLKEVDSQGNDFLLRTLADGMSELTLFLLTQGKDHVNPNQPNRGKQSALHVAMESKPIDLDGVDALLSHPRINVNQVNGQQETALHRATNRGYLPCVERLIKAGISLNAKNQHGKTALDIAYEQYDPADFAVLKCLMLSGAELDDVLLKAIASNQSEFIQFLLSEAQARVNPTITDVAGNPALLLAIEKTQLETVSWLLNHRKINPGQTDQAGNTGLHVAAILGNRAIIELLMKYGLSIKAKNKDQKTPMQLAMEKGHVELANWMQERHRHKKLEPFLKPLQEKMEQQAKMHQQQLQLLKRENEQFLKPMQEKLDEQKQVNQAQTVEIQSQKTKLEEQERVNQEQIQSLTRENEKLREALRKLEANVNKQSTVLGTLSIFSEKYAQSLMTVAEKAQRKQQQREQQQREQQQREQQRRQRDIEQGMKNPLQSQLVEACLKGEVELVKQLEWQGASLLYPNAEGLYPLVASVYGCSLETVRYVESQLNEEAEKQWGEVDAEEARKRLEKNTPTPLVEGATYGDVANWYVKHQGSSWCAYYDAACLKHLGYFNWGGWDGDYKDCKWEVQAMRWADDSARVRWAGRYVVKRRIGKTAIQSKVEGIKDVLSDAGTKVDGIVIQEIREQLEALKKEVVTKAKRSSSAVGQSPKT